MPVDYEGYWACCIRQAIALIANSATFQALDGVSAAADRIVEIDGGQDAAGTAITASSGVSFNRDVPLWAHVCPEPVDIQNIWLGAPFSTANEGMIPTAFYLRTTGLTHRHEVLRYCLSKVGLIARDITNQAGSAGMWRRIQCMLAGFTFLDVGGHQRGACRVGININFGDLA